MAEKKKKRKKIARKVTRSDYQLSPMQQRFVDEYLIDDNSTAAALRAGYSPKSASTLGSKLYRHPRIRAAIERSRKLQQKRTQITADKVLKELAVIGFLDPAGLFDDDGHLKQIKDMEEDVRRAIAALDVEELLEEARRGEGKALKGYGKKIRLNDKIRALELIGKHFKMWTEKQEVSGPDGKPLIVVGGPTQELSFDEWEKRAKERLK